MKLLAQIVALSSMLIGVVHADERVAYKRHVIQMPGGVSMCHCWQMFFRELDGDGMRDLIVASPAGDIYVYRQDRRGFPAEPTDRLAFPKGTAWYSDRDIDEDQNLEIVISTGEGLAYYIQNNGVFDTNPKPLVEIEQVFSGNRIEPIGYVGNKQAPWNKATEGSWPVVLSDRVIMFEPHKEYRYKPGATTELEQESYMWEGAWGWSLGGHEAYAISTQTVSQVPSEEAAREPEEENAYIKRMVEKVEGKRSSAYGTKREDIDGNGSEDVTFWLCRWKMGRPATTFMTFLRRADGGLPEEPDQILRFRGVPMKFYSGSSLVDINKDGLQDIVTIRFGDKPQSVPMLLEMATSEGLEWIVAVNFFMKGGGFSQRPDYEKRFTGIMPMFDESYDMVNFDGDFNGDSRPDLRIRRSPTEIEVYFSSANDSTEGDLFNKNPDLQFDIPVGNRPSVRDVNGDGIPDIQMVDFDKGRLTVYLSDRQDKEGDSR